MHDVKVYPWSKGSSSFVTAQRSKASMRAKFKLYNELQRSPNVQRWYAFNAGKASSANRSICSWRSG
jgi:hypothetical protein